MRSCSDGDTFRFPRLRSCGACALLRDLRSWIPGSRLWRVPRNDGEALMQIGIAGLGRMGAAMAARLMEVGHTVAVWNRTPEKAKPLVDAGAKRVDTPEDLAEHSEVIIT